MTSTKKTSLRRPRSALIVDDCDDHRTLLCQMVEALGFDVRACSGGHQALVQLAECSFDLVITDVQMPFGDGIWLVRQMRESGNQTPVLLISADVHLDDTDLKELNALGFLRKPLDFSLLQSVIVKAVEGDVSL